MLQVLLAHPGGPFYARKDNGYWSVPKGEPDENEQLLDAALREFTEETGLTAEGNFLDLGSIVQKGGKEVFAWAVEGNIPPGHNHTANLVKLELPPHSGKFISFPEIDKIEFFDIETAKIKIKDAQIPLIERLVSELSK